MYTCQKCHKKYESKSIPHFLDNYFCDNYVLKGSKEIAQEQYWSTDNENENVKKFKARKIKVRNK